MPVPQMPMRWIFTGTRTYASDGATVSMHAVVSRLLDTRTRIRATMKSWRSRNASGAATSAASRVPGAASKCATASSSTAQLSDEQRAYTKNIGVGGAFIITPDPPPPGAALQIALQVPAASRADRGARRRALDRRRQARRARGRARHGRQVRRPRRRAADGAQRVLRVADRRPWTTTRPEWMRPQPRPVSPARTKSASSSSCAR